MLHATHFAGPSAAPVRGPVAWTPPTPARRLAILAMSVEYAGAGREVREAMADAEAAFGRASLLTVARLVRAIALDPEARPADHVAVTLGLDALAARLPQSREVIAVRLTRPRLATALADRVRA